MTFCLLCSYFIASIQAAPSNRSGRMAPLYIVLITSCLILQDALEDSDKLWISFVHLSAAFFEPKYVIYNYAQIFHSSYLFHWFVV